jgi:predicted acetyltransferase
VILVAPSMDGLPSYRSALQRGWSSENAAEDPDAAARELAEIDADPVAFVAALNEPTRGGRPITLPDGSEVPRLPGIRRWMWEGDDYVGAISVRWQPGTMDLPPYCLGHIGYAVVPWQRRRGHATSALAQMLTIARDEGLPYVDIVTDLDNTGSQQVVRANGGELVEEFTTPVAAGGRAALRFRVMLNPGLGPHG